MRTSLDCPVVAGQSSDATEALQSETQAAFEAHAGGAPSAIATGPSMVRVAIVDQHSTRSGKYETYKTTNEHDSTAKHVEWLG